MSNICDNPLKIIFTMECTLRVMTNCISNFLQKDYPKVFFLFHYISIFLLTLVKMHFFTLKRKHLIFINAKLYICTIIAPQRKLSFRDTSMDHLSRMGTRSPNINMSDTTEIQNSVDINVAQSENNNQEVHSGLTENDSSSLNYSKLNLKCLQPPKVKTEHVINTETRPETPPHHFHGSEEIYQSVSQPYCFQPKIRKRLFGKNDFFSQC